MQFRWRNGITEPGERRTTVEEQLNFLRVGNLAGPPWNIEVGIAGLQVIRIRPPAVGVSSISPSGVGRSSYIHGSIINERRMIVGFATDKRVSPRAHGWI